MDFFGIKPFKSDCDLEELALMVKDAAQDLFAVVHNRSHPDMYIVSNEGVAVITAVANLFDHLGINDGKITAAIERVNNRHNPHKDEYIMQSVNGDYLESFEVDRLRINVRFTSDERKAARIGGLKRARSLKFYLAANEIDVAVIPHAAHS